MPDPNILPEVAKVAAASTAGVVATVHVTKDMLPRILGPTYDVIGKKLAGYTEYAATNLERIVQAAFRKAGTSFTIPNHIPQRAVVKFIEEGSSCDNELMAEYFGGILATCRKGKEGDDRAAYFVSIVGRLSAYQVRSHYVLYSFLKHIWNGKRLPFRAVELREKASIHIPLSNYARAMDCGPQEGLDPYVDHAITGLISQGLISDYYSYSDSAYALTPPCEIKGKSGIVIAPTRLGLELFMWAHGEDYPAHQVFFRDFSPALLPGVSIDYTGAEPSPRAQAWGDEGEPAILQKGEEYIAFG